MSKVKYKISKIKQEEKYRTSNGYDYDSKVVGFYVTVTNVTNPFDYFTQYIPTEAFSETEFALGRIIELEEER